MNSETISARFSGELVEKIDQLVKSGDFGSRGEFVQYAVRKILKQFEEGKNRFPPPMIKGQSRPIFSSRALTRFSSAS